ncbi:MAG: radical SAM protein [Bdellovibrionota bacterium]
MINFSKLLADQSSSSDGLRYGEKSLAADGTVSAVPAKSARERRPVVVWNLTRTCNLRCIHCYSDSESKRYSGELSTDEAKAVIDDLAGFNIPALLLSGGEPLVRHDFWELVPYAREKGLRLTLSTNGTLIDLPTAKKLKEAGFTYVGISLDGIGATNDFFRGKEGAFDAAVRGFRNCKEAGQRVGLRLTLTRHNYNHLDQIFDFIEQENIQRACFYHLVYSGRGGGLRECDLTHAETRDAIRRIAARVRDFAARGIEKEILTVDNPVDGVLLYLDTQENDVARANTIRERLAWNGGGRFSSGTAIADIDFLGNIHADQFWMHYSFGNVRQRPFSKIWTDLSDELLKGLRDQEKRIQGKCSLCRWYSLCGGGMRVRAERVYETPWAPDPACYLTLEECGISAAQAQELRKRGEWYDPPAALTNSNG